MTPSPWVRKARCPSPVLDSSESEPWGSGFTLKPNQGAESYGLGPGKRVWGTNQLALVCLTLSQNTQCPTSLELSSVLGKPEQLVTQE